MVEVRGYDGDPTVSGRIISYGASLPFTVPDVVPESLMGGPVNVSVIMRKVNAFTPVASADAWQLSNPPILAMAPVRGNGDVGAGVKDFPSLVWCVRGRMNAEAY